MRVTEGFRHASFRRVFFEVEHLCVSATFASNPQFLVRLEDVDDDPLDGEDGCTLLLGLMQKDGRRQKRLARNLETIGFAIYKVSTNTVAFQFRFSWINNLRNRSFKIKPVYFLFAGARTGMRQSAPPVTQMSASESRIGHFLCDRIS